MKIGITPLNAAKDVIVNEPTVKPQDTRAHVLCGKCRACCQHETVVLQPAKGDVVDSYLHWIMDGPIVEATARSLGIDAKTLPVLQRQSNGDCIYLGPKGCTIHDRAPVMCRLFDCRKFYVKYGRAGQPQINQKHNPIIEAGKKRLNTLPLSERLNIKSGGNGCD
jgi:Fe-S-cluster containining protein